MNPTRMPTCCAAATVLLTACATLRGGAGAAGREAACRPVTGPLPASATAAEMRGEFVLTMTATGGARASATARGRLVLASQDSALLVVEGGRARQPLRGTSTIVLDSVGAVPMGDLVSEAPGAPGVAVYEQRAADSAAPTILLRLGSGSNARGPQPFDAAYTTLFVQRITADGFAGGWSSSAGSTFPIRESRGFFCAVRAGP